MFIGFLQDHLACFIAGTLALGAMNGMPDSHLELARKIGSTCKRMYQTATGLGPEIVYFNEIPGHTEDIRIKVYISSRYFEIYLLIYFIKLSHYINQILSFSRLMHILFYALRLSRLGSICIAPQMIKYIRHGVGKHFWLLKVTQR